MKDKECSSIGCAREAKIKGFCKAHYSYWRTTGKQPVGAVKPKRKEKERNVPIREYMKKMVKQEGKCLTWTGAQAGEYGCIPHNGVSRPVQRVAFFHAHGRYPKQLNNKCGNKKCVNLDHWYEGNDIQGREDCRFKPGSINTQKLMPKQVLEIKELLATSSIRQKEIAKRYGVSRGTISLINCGKIWQNMNETERRIAT